MKKDATRRASYTYYKDGRMKSYSPAVPVGYGSLEYTWNSIGQKTSMKVPAGVGNLARMLEYRYDSTGRQVGLDVRMSTSVSSTGTAASVPGDTTRFFYDASQNRTKLINKAGDVYQYVYDPTASFPAAVYEQGPEYRYVNVRETDGALVSREKYNNTGQRVANSIYHFDGLGSTRAISDGSGTITDTYEYDAWGNTTHTSGTTADNPYQYVGRYGYYTHHQEPDFHLLQLGVRYYDPVMGRFTQRDSARDGINWYAYAYDSPTSVVDPTGMIVLRPGDWWSRQPMPRPHGWAGLCFGGICVNNRANDALAAAERRFPPDTLHNGVGDAFRHCLWACTVMRDCGARAYNSGVIDHEVDGAWWAQGSWNPPESQMDLANDEIGRKIAVSGQDCERECLNKANRDELYVLP